MKMNMIVGKKQIILASLVVILGIAIYLNWQFTNNGESLSVTGKLTSSLDDISDADKNYGDAELVSTANDDYFAKARLEKQKSRDSATETLKNLLTQTLTEQEKIDATAEAIQMAKFIDSEGKIESLVLAKGFSDCISYYDGEKVNVVVKTEGLEAAQAAQIKDIVVSQTKALAENITITEVK